MDVWWGCQLADDGRDGSFLTVSPRRARPVEVRCSFDSGREQGNSASTVRIDIYFARRKETSALPPAEEAGVTKVSTSSVSTAIGRVWVSAVPIRVGAGVEVQRQHLLVFIERVASEKADHAQNRGLVFVGGPFELVVR